MITYAITVADEEFEFRRLVESLKPYVLESQGERICVIADQNKITDNIVNLCVKHQLNFKQFDFKGDFSAFKNSILDFADTDYIFQIDADEQIPPSLINAVRSVFLKKECDCLAIPRINIVNGITESHLQEYQWRINERGWIQFPDFQVRAFANNGKIHWQNPVHEQIVRFEKMGFLQVEPVENFSILHVKDIKKQEKQNELYKTIGNE